MQIVLKKNNSNIDNIYGSLENKSQNQKKSQVYSNFRDIENILNSVF